MVNSNLEQLSTMEQHAIIDFIELLQEEFGILIQSILLFGSKARGDYNSDSDLDILIVIDSDDWRLHKQIRYLAVDVCLKYNYELDISPRIWSVAHFDKMKAMNDSFYKNICQDGITL